MRHLTYLALLAGCLVVTAPLELLLRGRVYARWRRLLLALLPEFVVFVAWVLYGVARVKTLHFLRTSTIRPVVSLARAGTNELSNLVGACRRCNEARGAAEGRARLKAKARRDR